MQYNGRVFALQLYNESYVRGKRIDQLLANYSKYTTPQSQTVGFSFTVPQGNGPAYPDLAARDVRRAGPARHDADALAHAVTVDVSEQLALDARARRLGNPGIIFFGAESACQYGMGADDMLLGFDFLKHFDFVFDYPHGRMFLHPNKN